MRGLWNQKLYSGCHHSKEPAIRYFLVFVFLLVPAVVFSATAQCPRYSVSVEGTPSMFGVKNWP